MWYAAKLAPKKYGSRQQVDVDLGRSVKPEDLDDRIAALLRKAAGGALRLIRCRGRLSVSHKPIGHRGCAHHRTAVQLPVASQRVQDPALERRIDPQEARIGPNLSGAIARGS